VRVLALGREPQLAQRVMRIFGATSLDQCAETYDMVGAAERATLDEAVKRITADASAAFQLSIENEAL